MLKIPENIIIVAKALLPMAAIIILFVILGNVGFGKINEIRDQITKTQSDQKTLTQKLEVLRTVSVNGAAISNLAASALPDSNTALVVMSQLKTMATSQNLIMADLKSSIPGVDPTGLSFTSINFNITGERTQLVSFINAMGTIVPLTIVNSIKITEDKNGNSLADITAKTFWSAYPTKIPAITEPISDLTPAENQTILNLGNYSQPSFIPLPSPENGGRTDPFSL